MDDRGCPPAGSTAGGETTTGERRESSATPAHKQAKWRRVLAAFLDRGLRGLNRFEAARELRDHVLPTTVSQLEARGVRILRREETVPGAFGPVHCCRYWLSPEACQRAWELLGLSTPVLEPRVAQNALPKDADAIQTLGSPTTDRKEVVPTTTEAHRT